MILPSVFHLTCRACVSIWLGYSSWKEFFRLGKFSQYVYISAGKCRCIAVEKNSVWLWFVRTQIADSIAGTPEVTVFMTDQWACQCICNSQRCQGFSGRSIKPREKHFEMLVPDLVSWKTQGLRVMTLKQDLPCYFCVRLWAFQILACVVQVPYRLPRKLMLLADQLCSAYQTSFCIYC